MKMSSIKSKFKLPKSKHAESLKTLMEEEFKVPVDDTNWSVFYLLCLTAECVGLMAVIGIIVWGEKYMCGYAWDGSDRMFNYHPVFMVLGLVFIYGNSTICYRILRTTPKFKVKLVHAGLHCVAFLFVIVGLYCVFQHHISEKMANMYSLHSWVGILTVVLFVCQYLLGFLAFFFPKFSEEHRKGYLHLHVFFGVVILAMAISACVTGLTEIMLFRFMDTWGNFPPVGIVANIIGLSLVLFGLLIGYILYNPDYKRSEQYYLLH